MEEKKILPTSGDPRLSTPATERRESCNGGWLARHHRIALKRDKIKSDEATTDKEKEKNESPTADESRRKKIGRAESSQFRGEHVFDLCSSFIFLKNMISVFLVCVFYRLP